MDKKESIFESSDFQFRLKTDNATSKFLRFQPYTHSVT